jgi:cytochrome o ubiquinol oxidase operon protein cyoD
MKNPSNKTVWMYVSGFILSLLLTLAAYVVVQIHVASEHSIISHEILIPTILSLAVLQLMVQLFCFLHLGQETGPRWNLAALLSTLALILIIIIASIWIMDHLNYNMSPRQMNQYIIDQSG